MRLLVMKWAQPVLDRCTIPGLPAYRHVCVVLSRQQPEDLFHIEPQSTSNAGQQFRDQFRCPMQNGRLCMLTSSTDDIRGAVLGATPTGVFVEPQARLSA